MKARRRTIVAVILGILLGLFGRQNAVVKDVVDTVSAVFNTTLSGGNENEIINTP